jgi:beta-aspartyl-peptidase (threonine type)
MNGTFAIAIHGGSGVITRDVMTPALRCTYENGLREALFAGQAILQKGGLALDAVQAAVMQLEDNPLFNAGKGSVFNRQGAHEMDAAIMDGRTTRAGAVAGISQVKNPIQLARAVLDNGKYVMLGGEKALRFAIQERLSLEPDEYFGTAERYEEWRRERDKPDNSTFKKTGTVGAVALDSHGHLAAATSTGGIVDKAFGRISDSCIVGGGTYANDETCAISCTGDGEAFILSVAAYDIAAMIAYQQLPLIEACDRLLNGKIRKRGASGGLVAIHRSGKIEMPFIAEGMYRACYHVNGNIECGIY